MAIGGWDGPSALCDVCDYDTWGDCPRLVWGAPLALLKDPPPVMPWRTAGKTYQTQAKPAKAGKGRNNGPKARFIPAWGNAPCYGGERHKRQRRDSFGPASAVLDGWQLGDGTGLQPFLTFAVTVPGAIAPGWNGARLWRCRKTRPRYAVADSPKDTPTMGSGGATPLWRWN